MQLNINLQYGAFGLFITIYQLGGVFTVAIVVRASGYNGLWKHKKRTYLFLEKGNNDRPQETAAVVLKFYLCSYLYIK